MKKEKTFTYCECCDEPIEIESPPKDEYYESGQIHIKDGSLLLPDNVASPNAHAAYLEGYYCNYVCLMKRIKRELHIVN